MQRWGELVAVFIHPLEARPTLDKDDGVVKKCFLISALWHAVRRCWWFYVELRKKQTTGHVSLHYEMTCLFVLAIVQ